MKIFTEYEVKKLLETQRGNCYVAVLMASRDKDIAIKASQAPLPGGDRFDEYYGFDDEILSKETLLEVATNLVPKKMGIMEFIPEQYDANALKRNTLMSIISSEEFNKYFKRR